MKLVKPDRAHWLSGSATDRLFIITIAIKGIDGLLGVASGLIFLFLAPHTLDRFVEIVTANELARDPDDILVGLIKHGAEVFAASDRHFAGLYLIVHGVLKAFVALLLLSGRHWAYPVGAAFVSHDHRDHLDEDSIKALAAKFPNATIVAGLRSEEILHEWAPSNPVSTIGWFQQIADLQGLKITFVPLRHWSRRGLFDTNWRLWGGFVIEGAMDLISATAHIVTSGHHIGPGLTDD